MKTINITELKDKYIANFLAELNELMFKHGFLINGNAGVHVRRLPEDFKGYMAEKWVNGDGFDLRQINKKLVYPSDPDGDIVPQKNGQGQ